NGHPARSKNLACYAITIRQRTSGPWHLSFRLNLYARVGPNEQDNADFLRSLQHICFHGDADAGDAGVIGCASCGGDLGWVRAARSTGLRATDLPRRGLHLDSRLLGM